MTKRILAIGNSSNYETDAFTLVQRALREHGHDATLFCQDKCLDGEMIETGTKGNTSYCRVRCGVSWHDVGQFDAIWYLKPHIPRQLREHPNHEVRAFTHRQFHSLRESLWHTFADKRWLDNPWLQTRAENKAFQLRRAVEAGLRVPDTLITSDPESAKAFYQEHHGQMVVKLLATSPIPNRVLYTHEFTKDDLERIDRLALAPCILQERIAKHHELRVTIVRDEVFAVRIHSQEDERTALDWRRKPKHNDFDLRVEPCDISPTLAERLRLLLAKLGLSFGCADVIVTPEGQEVFLEVNPNGQWCFIQKRTGQDIASAIARALTH